MENSAKTLKPATALTPHDPRHLRYALAANAVIASMSLDGRALMTANDAQRVVQIFTLLHLDRISAPEPEREPGQVTAPHQPPADPRLADIEERLTKALGTIPEKTGA